MYFQRHRRMMTNDLKVIYYILTTSSRPFSLNDHLFADETRTVIYGSNWTLQRARISNEKKK